MIFLEFCLSTSQKIGLALVVKTQLAEATKDLGETKTSSFSFKSKLCKANLIQWMRLKSQYNILI